MDDQFEFGCITGPGSPNAPADRLFSNGKLQPHVFPVVPRQGNHYSSFSRASSISSKGSLVSSRSNSTNSARTSASEGGSSSSERRLSSKRSRAPVPQRSQLIAAVPVLKHRVGSRSKAENLDRKIPAQEGPGGAKTPWFGRRILKTFVSACKECHAITT